MVSFSSRISPRTSTVILRERSPLATAVVTSAMLRTWAVRLPAIELTVSVRSCQVPATPSTPAWPPSLPSVPTSRATRVTSAAKERSWSTIVLMVFLSSSTSPWTSTVILRERSPLATAVVTSPMLRTWAVRLPAIELTESVRSFQVPATSRTSAWPPSLPSVPTSRATRVTSAANERSCPTIVLMVIGLERHGLREIALGDGPDHPRGLAGRLDEAGDQRVHIGDRVRPRPGDGADGRAFRDLAVLSDGEADALQLGRQALIQLDHFVERVRDLAGDPGPVIGQPHREIALTHGFQGT